MDYKDILSGVGIVLTVVAFYPYIYSIFQGITKPHVFTWLIWGSTTFVIFLAQLADKGGAGAWPIGVSGIITLYVAWLAYTRKSDSSITRSDWFFLYVAMASLPLWYYTSDPVWTVVILTTIDLAGFAPTFRKAYVSPYEEKLMFYNVMAVRNLVVLIALENYTLTTILFPLATGIVCVGFILMVAVRRHRVSNE